MAVTERAIAEATIMALVHAAGAELQAGRVEVEPLLIATTLGAVGAGLTT